MTETTNLHLPQFAESDRIHHDDFNDAFAAIDAAIGAIPIVKLKDQTLASPAATWNIDVSGIDFTQYRKIELDIYMPTTDSIEAKMRINNATDCYNRGNGAFVTEQSDHLAEMNGTGISDCYDPQSVFLFNMPMAGRCVRCVQAELSPTEFRWNDTIAWGVTWDALDSFQLIRTGGSLTAIPAGSRFILNGYKK